MSQSTVSPCSAAGDRASPMDPDALFALVVEDEPLIRKAVKLMVQNCGYVVVTAGDGQDAVETAPLFPFAVIVTDLEMPRLGGLEALRRIRAMGGRFAAIPAIVASGLAAPSDGVCSELGIRRFVPKSGNFRPLQETLRQIRDDALAAGDAGDG